MAERLGRSGGSVVAWTAGFTFVLTGLALALNWPLFARFGSTVPNDLGDPLLNIWILWWNAHHIPFTAAYWNAPIFAPAPYTFALSETLIGLTWLTTPLQWLGASPLEAYNVMYVATPILNGLAAYWLCLTLTRRPYAAAIGGLAFAFAPYHASQLAHIQTQAMFWMPVALVGLHQYWQTQKRMWLVCLGVATTMNALTCGYFLLYFTVFLGIAVLWLTIASGTRGKVTWVAVTLMLAAMPVLPVAVIYRLTKNIWHLSRPIAEIKSFSADVLTVFVGSDRLIVWPIHGQDWQPLGGLYPQYPGIVILLLVFAGAVAAFRKRRRASPSEGRDSNSRPGLYATGAVAASVLALGPVARAGGTVFWSHPPFAWLMALPGFDATRVPALFVVITVLCLSVLAADAVARLWPVLTRRGAAVIALLAMAMVLDGWSILPVKDAPAPIPAMSADLVVELPRPDVLLDDTAAMYRAMQHGRPIVNGYSGYYPPHYPFLIYDLRNYCIDSLDTIRGSRSLDVILWRNKPGAGALDNVMVERWGRANREETVGMVLFHVPRAPGRPSPALVDPDDLWEFCAEVRQHPPNQ